GAANGQAGERRGGGGGGKEAPRDRRHAVIAGMISNRDRTEPPQCRDLVGVKPRRAGQSGNKHDRQRVWHLRELSARGAADYRLVRKSKAIRLTCCAAGGALRLTFRQLVIWWGQPKQGRFDRWARIFV